MSTKPRPWITKMSNVQISIFFLNFTGKYNNANVQEQEYLFSEILSFFWQQEATSSKICPLFLAISPSNPHLHRERGGGHTIDNCIKSNSIIGYLIWLDAWKLRHEMNTEWMNMIDFKLFEWLLVDSHRSYETTVYLTVEKDTYSPDHRIMILTILHIIWSKRDGI